MWILVVFVDVYEKMWPLVLLDLYLFMGILSVVVIVSHIGPKFVLGLNFSVCMCYLVRQNQKKSWKYGPSVCVASQKQNRNMQLFYSFVVYNSLIVNCIRVKW